MRAHSIASLLSTVFTASLAFAVGCDSGTSGDSAGRGSDTLVVEGRVSAENLVDNASSAPYFVSDFSVTVTKAGTPVPGAVVTIDSSGGPITLTYNGGNGRYEGSQSGYFGTYTLDVLSGDDYLRDVRVAGPDAHTITAPTGNDPIDAAAGVEVRWHRNVTADAVRIETSQQNFDVEDTGTFTLPFAAISCDTGAVKEETVDIRRERRIIPNGATGTSLFTVRVQNGHTFLVLPNPGC